MDKLTSKDLMPGYIGMVASFIFCIFVFTYPSYAKSRLHPERYYQEKFCNEIGGVSGFKLDDMTPIDCIANDYVIKINFADEWYEATTKALYYAMKTNMKPGIALIIETKRDCVYYYRMLKTIKEFDLPYDLSTRNVKEFGLPLELPDSDISGSLYTINGRC